MKVRAARLAEQFFYIIRCCLSEFDRLRNGVSANVVESGHIPRAPGFWHPFPIVFAFASLREMESIPKAV